MVVMGVVQTLMALMTISPTLSEQFSALVNLAVVTNVIPYIVALSALPVMMQTARVAQTKYRTTSYCTGRDALQRLRAVRFRQGCRLRGNARGGARLGDLGIHRPALLPVTQVTARAA